jgi:hypothetical protein
MKDNAPRCYKCVEYYGHKQAHDALHAEYRAVLRIPSGNKTPTQGEPRGLIYETGMVLCAGHKVQAENTGVAVFLRELGKVQLALIGSHCVKRKMPVPSFVHTRLVFESLEGART